jgi:chromosomal replication initiation ATPase DnaA
MAACEIECEVIDLGAQRRAPALIRLVGWVAAELFAVGPDLVMAAARGSARAALARQVQVYLLHVGFGLHPAWIGRLVGRDRSTVIHACAAVEDRRDDPAFDAALGVVEAALRAWAVRFPEGRP